MRRTVTRHNRAMAVMMLPEAFDALVAAADAGLATGEPKHQPAP